MIQPQTKVRVTDNSGAKIAQVFKILGGTRRRYAEIGDVVVIAVKVAEPRKMVKKKTCCMQSLYAKRNRIAAKMVRIFVLMRMR